MDVDLKGKSLASAWQKASPRAKKGDDAVSKFIAVYSTVFKEYDRARFVDGVSGDNAKGDTDRYVKALGDYVGKLDTATKSVKDWSPTEKKFLGELASALDAELKFWKSNPIQDNVPILVEKDLRKHWNERKKAAMDAFAKLHPKDKFPFKFDKDLGPNLDAFEAAKTHADRVKYGTRAQQAIKQYVLDVKGHRKTIGDVPADLIEKQLFRVDNAVAKGMK